MKPLISIIIPTYNRVRGLDRALKSVLVQTYQHWEALVVDNCSSDNTDDLIKSFNDPRIKLFKVHNEGIIAVSRNLGINQARGEYIAFLDSDDWWSSKKLEKSIKYLRQGADVVYHDLFLATKSNQRLFWRKARTRNLKSPVFQDLLMNGNTLGNSSVVIRKDLLSTINGLSEDRNLIAIEDYDAWLRIAKFTEKFKRIPQTLGYYWVGGGNMSNPTRLLKNLNTIEERFAKEMLDLYGYRSIYWLSYAKGRAYYCLGYYKIAKKNLERVLLWRAPFKLIIRSVYMIFFGSARMFFNSLRIRLW